MDPILAEAAAVPLQGRLWAIGDLHLSYKDNREALEKLQPHPDDDLILCGDVGESIEHCRMAFGKAKQCFRNVYWVPGNHELYTLPSAGAPGARGEAKYHECVATAQQMGIVTPEDEYTLWDGAGGPCLIAPIFTLYDYSFRPADVRLEDALAWARAADIEATDEHLLHPDPYPSRIAWCHARIASTEQRLADAIAAHPDVRIIIAGHWPLREELVKLPAVPRFSLWCGTTKTHDWHLRFHAKVVVSGHLHIPRTDWVDGTRFEEVSLGYPRQWRDCREQGLDINDLLREILPGPETPPPAEQRITRWRRYG